MMEQGSIAGAHPGGLDLDAFAIDESLDRDRIVREHLTGCERCSERVRRFRQHCDEFAAGAWQRTLPEVRRRVDAHESKRRTGRPYWQLLLPIAAALALVSLGLLRRTATDDLHPAIVMKGGPSLAVHLRRAGQVSTIVSGASVHPGDEIRFVVRPTEYRYLLIVSLDSSGHASVYYPFEGAQSGLLAEGDEIAVQGSIVLDATRGPERIFALFSRKPIEAEKALRPLRAVARGRIREPMQIDVSADAQDSFLLENVGEASEQ